MLVAIRIMYFPVFGGVEYEKSGGVTQRYIV